jgi:hypothetical protein
MDIPPECNLLDREIEEYPEDLKEQVVRLSDWIREPADPSREALRLPWTMHPRGNTFLIQTGTSGEHDLAGHAAIP